MTILCGVSSPSLYLFHLKFASIPFVAPLNTLLALAHCTAVMDYAFEWIARGHGIHEEAVYPYTAADGECRRGELNGRRIVTIDGYEDVPQVCCCPCRPPRPEAPPPAIYPLLSHTHAHTYTYDGCPPSPQHTHTHTL